MQRFTVALFIIILAVIAAYAIFQQKPSGFSFRNIFSLSGLRLPTSTPISGSSRVGQTKPISQAKPGPSAPPSGSYGGGYGAPTRQPQINPSEIPSGFTLRDLSPYFKKFQLSASAGSFGGSYSQVLLYAYSGNEPVDVTGWSIRSNRGITFISQGIDVYDPSGLSPESDIYLKNGDTVYIYSTVSGITKNFRLNKCIGYLSNYNTFTPPLDLDCPDITRLDVSNFTGDCQRYILSLDSCQIPAANPPVAQNDYACRAFINKLNYGGCFSNHRNDYDFLSNRWWVWTGRQFLDFQHDRLLLFDKEDLLVNEYSY